MMLLESTRGEQNMTNVKGEKVGHLTFNDFTAHPIWTWADDDKDESLVIPVQSTGTLPTEGEG
jgi:hypothetical protein